MRKALSVLVALMWGALLLGGAFRPQASSKALTLPRPGYTAPPIAGTDFEGNPVRLDQLQGNAVFVNLWASWCGPCRMEMPEIARLAENLPPDTAIFTVNMTSTESSPARVAAYLQEHGYTFPVVLDPDGRIGKAYQAVSLPTSIFISPEGTVTARVQGPLTYRAMQDYLKAAGR